MSGAGALLVEVGALSVVIVLLVWAPALWRWTERRFG